MVVQLAVVVAMLAGFVRPPRARARPWVALWCWFHPNTPRPVQACRLAATHKEIRLGSC